MDNSQRKEKPVLIDYLLNKGGERGRSIEGLQQNLDDVLTCQLSPKELALVLYHAVKQTHLETYGDKKSALIAIENRIQKWTDKTIKAKGEYSGFTISHMLESFQLLNLRPPERFMEFASKKADELAKDFNKDDMSSALSAFAHLGVPPSHKFLSAVKNRMPAVQEQFTPDQTYSVLWSLAVIDSIEAHYHGAKRYQTAEIFADLLNTPRVREKLASSKDIAHHNMLSDSILWFKGQTPISRRGEEETASLFEDDVKVVLKNAGAKILSPRTIETPKHKLDIVAEFNNRVFFIECDGPTHFIKTADDHKVFMNGPTIFQTALIKRANPDTPLVRIPTNIFYQHAEDPEFWESLLVEIDDTRREGAFLLGTRGIIPLVSGYEDGPKCPNC